MALDVGMPKLSPLRDVDITLSDLGGGQHRISWDIRNNIADTSIATGSTDFASTSAAHTAMASILADVADSVAETVADLFTVVHVEIPKFDVNGVTIYDDPLRAIVTVTDNGNGTHGLAASVIDPSEVEVGTYSGTFASTSKASEALNEVRRAATAIMQGTKAVTDLGASFTITFEPVENMTGLTMDPPYTIEVTHTDNGANEDFAWNVKNGSATSLDTGTLAYPDATEAHVAVIDLRNKGREVVSDSFTVADMDASFTLPFQPPDHGTALLNSPYKIDVTRTFLDPEHRIAWSVKKVGDVEIGSGSTDYAATVLAKQVFSDLKLSGRDTVRDEVAVSSLGNQTLKKRSDSPVFYPYSQNSPHFPHMNVLAFTRAIKYHGDTGQNDLEYRWTAEHADITEDGGGGGMTTCAQVALSDAYNSNLKHFRYEFDHRAVQMSASGVPGGADQPIFEDKTYWDAQTESMFLHVSQDTVLDLYDANDQFVRTVNLTAGDRWVSIYSNWETYLFYPGDSTYRTFQSARLISRANTSPGCVDGTFLDVHAPDPEAMWRVHSGGADRACMIRSGGGFAEYGDQGIDSTGLFDDVNTDMASWLTQLRSDYDSAGLSELWINPSEELSDPAIITRGTAAGGVTAEFIHVVIQTENFWATKWGPAEATFLAAGVNVDAYGRWGIWFPTGSNADEYPESRSLMWRLANYYIYREDPTSPGTGTMYFNPTCNIPVGGGDTTWIDRHWPRAFEFDIGLPVSAESIVASGTYEDRFSQTHNYKIHGREFTNGYVLIRNRDEAGAVDYRDTSGVSYTLPTTMSALLPDGSFGPPVTAVSIRNSEGIILVPV